MKTKVFAAVLCLLLLAPSAAFAKKKHHSSSAPGSFDYYLLALSWAPNYCAGHPTDHSGECKVGNHTAFVLHGLWPQSNTGRPPMSCASASPVARAIVDHMRQYFPSDSLIQHEWAKHGTCSGLTSQEYFDKVEQAFKNVQVPAGYVSPNADQQPKLKDLEQSFADANHAPAAAFRVSCAGTELVNLEVCLSKGLQFQACSASVHECSAPKVRLRKTR